jgi:hypothetical protein
MNAANQPFATHYLSIIKKILLTQKGLT